MTPPSDLDAIDFKPFFDMVVGVLFVLLILVAAQMFFIQWAGSPQEMPAREKTEQAALAWEKDITELLEDIAARLHQNKLDVTIDRVRRSLSIPFAAIAEPKHDQAPRITAASGKLSEVLAGRLRCLPSQTGPKSADCPAVSSLRLGRLEVEARIGEVPEGVRLPADHYASLVSTLLGAALLQDSAELLAITGTGGIPALHMKSSVLGPSSLQSGGDVAIHFVFEQPLL